MRNIIQTADSSELGGDVRVDAHADHFAGRDNARSWYVLIMLTVSYSLAYIDRQLLNLLVDPIKRSLLISDTQLSLVQGLAFISAYLLAAPLFGRLVDTSNRRNVLLAGICLWSVFTALCGRADTYFELFAARFGVGASEACVLPVGWSIISDIFSTRRTPRAMSIFMLGPLLGGGFSLLAGGAVIMFAKHVRVQVPLLANLDVWQMAFVLIGAPGILLALLLLLTVREPRRSQSLVAVEDDRKFTTREAADFLWQRRGFYTRVYLALGTLGMVVLGIPSWLPSFLIRFHGVAPAAVGFRFGVIVVTLGAAGVLIGPWVARLLEKRGYEDATLRTAAFSLLATLVASAAIPFAPGADGALTAAAAAIFFSSLPTGVMAASMQRGTPSRMRGVVAALYTFSGQLIGFGLGPTSIALVTDKFFHDPKMVGYSIGIVCPIAAAMTAYLLFSSLRHYRRILAEERAAKALADRA